jgi:hypothetical protein
MQKANVKTITLLFFSHSLFKKKKNGDKCGMLPLGAKQSGGKLFHHSDLWGSVFPHKIDMQGLEEELNKDVDCH